MKKVLLTTAAFLIAVAASAQITVGGGIGFDKSMHKFDGDKVRSETAFILSPEIGYILDDKLEIGLGFNVISAKQKDEANSVDLLKTSGWEIAPYARYSFLEFGKVKFMAKASLGFGGSKEKQGAADEEKFTNFGLSVLPEIGYDINERFSLIASLNFMGLGFESETQKGKTNGDKKDTQTDFAFGFNTNNLTQIGGTNGLVTVGFVLKF